MTHCKPLPGTQPGAALKGGIDQRKQRVRAPHFSVTADLGQERAEGRRPVAESVPLRPLLG